MSIIFKGVGVGLGEHRGWGWGWVSIIFNHLTLPLADIFSFEILVGTCF